MPFTLDQVVPWGRSFDEYVAMFALGKRDLQRRILGCGDGPAAFNAELTRRGGEVVSVDPLYQFSAAQIERRIAATCDEVLRQTRENRHTFVWTSIPSVEELGARRMTAMQVFLSDYEQGRAQGRHLAGELPSLPIRGQRFELALCSHLLFLYSAHLSLDFHCRALMEMCRAAREARVFPLLGLDGCLSPHVEPVRDALGQRGYAVSIERVPYEFQQGGNEMMRVVGPERSTP